MQPSASLDTLSTGQEPRRLLDGAAALSRDTRIVACALLLISVAYYGLYINAGFNYADDGNYAQISYELLLGRPPSEIAFNYGLLWFKAGEWLFRLFGVHFLLVKLLFFACIALTNLLVFAALLAVAGNAWLAGALAMIPLLVPAFPATAFYGLCTLINAAAQLRLAARIPRASAIDAALAGAALGLSLQIRPDFGYIFAAPLGVILLLGFLRLPRPWLGKTVIGAACGFLAASAPFAIAAVVGGYGRILAHQYLDYPQLLLSIFLSTHPATPGASGILARAGVDNVPLALLTYLPLVGLALFGVFIACDAWRQRRALDPSQIGVHLVALTAGLAAFPHYFLFRPDFSHIANFMPGYVVMAGVFLIALWRTPGRDMLALPRLLRALVPVLIAVHFGLFLWVGLPSREAGSIGLARGRSERFIAENGVDVKVTADEKRALESVRDIIERHSRPGDAIVCLPYCPGLAFMTARRMLLPNFYVDENFLTQKPGWLAASIAAVAGARPPVVVIQDWAINGTEFSRFPHWAAPFVDAVGTLALQTATVPGMTLYLLAPSSAQ